jgi:hypothetical protein
MLFLNKEDLFREKIKHVPLKRYFPNFNGGQDYGECLNFIKKGN